MKLQLLAAASAAAALVAVPAWAQPEQGRWSVSLEAGADFPVEGDLNGGINAFIPDIGVINPDIGVINPDFTGAEGTIIRVNPVNYNDVYDTGWAVGGEVGYGLSDNAEVFGTIRYSSASGGTTQFGRLQDVETTAVVPINISFDDHEVWTGDIGYRQYFGGQGRWRPYAAGRIGVAYTSGIDADLFTPGGELQVNGVTFYDDSWSFTFGGDLGVHYQATDRFAIQGEVGLRWISDLSDETGPGLVNLGIAELNQDSGSSLSAPVMLRGKYTW